MNEDLTQNEAATVFELYYDFPNLSEKITTNDFIQTTAKIVKIVDRFGKVFSPVTNDLNGNLQKLTQKYEKDTNLHKYLEDMILREQFTSDLLATDALLWLKRGLLFISTMFQMIIDDSNCEPPSNDLAPILKRAYAATLEHHHGWLGVQLFNVLSRFMPNRRQFIYTLAFDRQNQEQVVIRDMCMYNEKLKNIVQNLTDFYDEYELDSTATA